MRRPLSDGEKQRQLQALLALYGEQCAHGRHTETQRHGVAVMFLTITGVFLSVIGSMRFSLSVAPLAVGIVLLGSYAYRFVAEFEAKWVQASGKRDHYRWQIVHLTGIVDAPGSKKPPLLDAARPPVVGSESETKTRADAKTRAKAGKGTLRVYWRRTFFAVIAAGLTCLLIIMVKAIWPEAAHWAVEKTRSALVKVRLPEGGHRRP